MPRPFSSYAADALPKRRVRKEWRFFVVFEEHRPRWDRIILMLVAASLWIGIITAVRMLWR